MMAEDNLTPKQRRFVEEYLVDLNGTQAAIRAGYSEKTANEQSSRLLVNVNIAAALQEAMDARSRRTQITADWVLQRLVKLADYDTKDFATLERKTIEVKPKGGGDPVEIEIQDVVFNEEFDGTVTGGLSKGKDGIKLELPDRLRALDMIGKHLGMWKERIEHSGTMTQQVVDLSHLSDGELAELVKKNKLD